MGEKPAVLEHVTDLPQVAGRPGPGSGIHQDLVTQGNRPLGGPFQASDEVEHRGLAATRRAEQRRDSAFRLEPDLQVEVATPVADVDLQGHRDALALRTRRASHSETTSATSEMAMDTAVSRSAGASPPGTWV